MTDAHTIAAASLAKASCYDPRQRREDLAILETWAGLLERSNLTSLDDAIQAVDEFYDREESPVMMVGDLVARMRAKRNSRPRTLEERQAYQDLCDRKAGTEPTPIEPLTGADVAERRAAEIAAFAAGKGRLTAAPGERF